MDVVYVVRHGNPNDALRYSLRSLAQHIPHDKVWLAGFTPPWATGVRSVPTSPARSRWVGSTVNLAAALRERFLSRTFLLFNDDFYATAAVDEVPVLHRGPLLDLLPAYRYTHGSYGEGVRAAREMLKVGDDEPLSYEMHAPLPVVKADMRAVLDSIEDENDARRRLAMHTHKRTVYGNRYGIGGERAEDCKVHSHTAALPSGLFVSTSPQSFAGRAGRQLREMFPDPCKYERGR